MATPSSSPYPRYRWLRPLVIGITICLCGALALLGLSSGDPPVPRTSNYAISTQFLFNQPSYYPIQQTLPEDLYRPTGAWLGRLILPTQEQIQTDQGRDWIWFEVLQAPDPELLGQILKLAWGPGNLAQTYPPLVTTDVHLGEVAERSQIRGDVVPTRLDGQEQVGPLRSLSGARPQDDVIVSLMQVTTDQDQDGDLILWTDLEPVLVVGRWMTLVQILEPVPRDRPGTLELCPEDPPCASEFYRVRHYDPTSGDFRGPEEIVRIPQQPPDRNQVFPSTPARIESSAAGQQGWYLYGAQDEEGIFTVQALQPRALMRLQPDQVILGTRAGLQQINQGNWQDTPARKGQVSSVLVDPEVETQPAALERWQEGDYGLVMHLFGGIGGEKAEPTIAGVVQGHFSFGLAQVVRDPFTDELIFEILYQQVYAHNPHGIIAGTHTWASYTGNLQRGWLGSRPISDVIVKLDLFTQGYRFETETETGSEAASITTLEIFPELLAQLQVMMGRYRTGDGTGTAIVTPATSCVQDSSQALYITIQAIRRQFDQIPNIDTWIRTHPDSPQLQRMGRLGALAQDLEARLAPYGVVRSDWRQNTEALAGIDNRGGFSHNSSLLNALLSWRTMLPRRAQDELAQIFLNYGAQLWFLRTNQVGGWDPTLLPLAPTTVLQQIPVIATPLQRLGAAMGTPLRSRGWTIVILGLGIYGSILLVLKGVSGITPNLTSGTGTAGSRLARILPMGSTALLSEILFRVALIPHPVEGTTPLTLGLWAGSSVLLFSLLALGSLRIASGPQHVPDRSNLLLIPILGLVCTIVYALTGSLMGIWVLHWIAGLLNLFTLQPQIRVEHPSPHPGH